MRSLLIVFMLCLATSFLSHAQTIDWEKHEFEFTRLPFKPLPKNLTTYSCEVLILYEDDVINIMESNKEKRGDTDQAVSDYKKMSTGKKLTERVLFNERKPSTRTDLEYTPKLYDAATIESSISLDGYTRSASGDPDFRIVVGLEGFQVTDIIPSTKDMRGIMRFFTSYSYKHQMVYKIVDRNNNVLYSATFFNAPKIRETTDFSKRDDADKHWRNNKDRLLRAADEEETLANITKLQAIINDTHGFSKVLRKTQTARVDSKKADYADYEEALQNAIIAYNKLSEEDRRAEFEKGISKSLELWLKALAEADPKNKKARIDGKVSAVTHLNCAEAYIWLNNFDEAELHLTKAKLLEFFRFEEILKEKSALLEDMRARYNANKKM